MKFLLFFTAKLIFTLFCCIRILLSFLWHLNIKKVDFRITDEVVSNPDKGYGTYYKNIFDYWTNTLSYDEKLGDYRKQDSEQCY